MNTCRNLIKIDLETRKNGYCLKLKKYDIEKISTVSKLLQTLFLVFDLLSKHQKSYPINSTFRRSFLHGNTNF